MTLVVFCRRGGAAPQESSRAAPELFGGLASNSSGDPPGRWSDDFRVIPAAYLFYGSLRKIEILENRPFSRPGVGGDESPHFGHFWRSSRDCNICWKDCNMCYSISEAEQVPTVVRFGGPLARSERDFFETPRYSPWRSLVAACARWQPCLLCVWGSDAARPRTTGGRWSWVFNPPTPSTRTCRWPSRLHMCTIRPSPIRSPRCPRASGFNDDRISHGDIPMDLNGGGGSGHPVSPFPPRPCRWCSSHARCSCSQGTVRREPTGRRLPLFVPSNLN